MKININELVQIGNLCEKFSNRVVSARLAYKLAKLSKAISEDINFYQEKYIEYLDKFGERDDNGDFISNGGNIKIISGLEQECKEKFNELNSIEVEIPNIKFSLEELEQLNMTMKDILILDPFIEE